jgi:hypothetical protein
MKVRCIRLLDVVGQEVEFSPWLTLGRVYHVVAIFVSSDGKRSYSIVTHEREGEWPQMANHQSECFEIVSTIIPSNWSVWVHESSAMGISPTVWQDPSFNEGFYDLEPNTYPIFKREREIILREDP